MKRHYRIAPGPIQMPSDAEIARYRDPRRLFYNYHRALHAMHRKPLYKDRKAFLALLLIVLLAWLLSDAADRRKEAGDAPPPSEQHVP